ncbi:MAG: ACT domain-containing protein [Candidatus Accumulibacter sp.]|nr:ACT domain-containing protein [Accumulibacter sp.]
MIDQITVFLENDRGRLAALCRALGDAGISMRALTLADTASYGVARIIADTPARAREVLDAAGFRTSLTRVFAVEVPDQAGSLATLLEVFDAAGINVEYAYCFTVEGGKAIDVLRTDSPLDVGKIIADAGFRTVGPEMLYRE